MAEEFHGEDLELEAEGGELGAGADDMEDASAVRGWGRCAGTRMRLLRGSVPRWWAAGQPWGGH